MRTLYLDCGMGAAGDMLTAALLELLPQPDEFVKRLNGLGIPGVTYCLEQAEKCGITGSRVTVTVNGETEHDHDHEHAHDHEHVHDHEHDHDHEHAHHHHNGMHEIGHIVERLPVSDRVRRDILAVYDGIAQAESHVHGVPVEDIHFHEVGTMDALADVAAVCLLLGFVALACLAFVYAGTRTGAMEKLLEEGDYTRQRKAKSRLVSTVSVCYWLVVTAVFLFYTFGPLGNGQARYSWFIWAVAGVLYGAVAAAVNAFEHSK